MPAPGVDAELGHGLPIRSHRFQLGMFPWILIDAVVTKRCECEQALEAAARGAANAATPAEPAAVTVARNWRREHVFFIGYA